MKKRISTFIAALAVTALGAQAQWTPDDKAYTVLGMPGVYGQGGLKTMRTADGRIVLTWHNTPKDVDYTDPTFGYYLYMQSFDKDGKPMLGTEGKIISAQPTKSWVSGYGTALLPNGNVVMAYTDTRNDADGYRGENYMYCYTPEGESVWSKDGVKMASFSTRATWEDLEPMLCVSGNNLYAIVDHVEKYNVKADSTNWEPSPWYPDEEMPDSVEMEDNWYQVMAYDTNGNAQWEKPVEISSESAWMYTAPDGGVYVVYVNKGSGFDARRIGSDGKDVWAKPVTVESGTITGGSFTDEPAVTSDGNGGLMFAYRKLLTYSGYAVTNHLTADGTVYEDEFIVNGTQDGDAETPVIAVNDGKAFVAFSYKYEDMNLWVNQVAVDGDYTWDGDSLLGYSYDSNEMWGMVPVKAIAQNDGWILLYGNAQSWNGANFYVCKIGLDGKTIWKRQIAENNFAASGFSIVSDDANAYIFYTCDVEYDDDWNEIEGEGGMRVMCVSIKDTTDGINSTLASDDAAEGSVYTLDGRKIEKPATPGLYIVKRNGVAKKVYMK